jgi:D-lactate dehydrogenase
MPTDIQVALFDTKPYDREYFTRALTGSKIGVHFHEFRLNAATAAAAAGCRAVCAFVNDTLDRPCLEILAGQGVGLIALRSAGFNHVDAQAARDLQLRVVRVPAYSPHAVAEHSVALLQTLNRKIHRAYNRVRELNFSLGGLVGFDLHGKTIGIIGTGKIGRLTAQIFRGFGCHVMAYDPQQSAGWASEHGIVYATFEEVIKSSDVISLHLPLTPETHHLIGENSIASMKRGSMLVNTSRGKLVDTAAVISALKSGHLGGVAMDVYEEEEGVFFEDLSGAPLQDDVLSRLLTFPNVLITAHQAFLTEEALGAISAVTVDSVHRHLTGLPPVDERVVV